MDDWFSTKEASEETGIKIKTLQARITKGLIKSILKGKTRLISKDEVERLKGQSDLRRKETRSDNYPNKKED